MRCAVYYSNKDIRILDRPRPEPGPNELLIKIEASGICGSDVMEWYRRDKVPLVLGHEIAGIIEETGHDVPQYVKGQRIACAHHVPCGKCHYCLSGHETVCDTLRKTNFSPGGFCEFALLSPIHVEKGVFLLPESVSFNEATFVEPLACILRGQRLAGGVKNKSILVLGSGIAGNLHILLARHNGARLIFATDNSEYRLGCATKFGADKAVFAAKYNPEQIREINQGRLADMVIVTAGAESAVQQAINSVERGGAILFFAPLQKEARTEIPFNGLFWRQEITLTSAYAGSPADYKEALDLIAAKQLNLEGMITHHLRLSEIGEGFRLVSEAKESLKVIIYPQK